jgi:hypothetical protein
VRLLCRMRDGTRNVHRSDQAEDVPLAEFHTLSQVPRSLSIHNVEASVFLIEASQGGPAVIKTLCFITVTTGGSAFTRSEPSVNSGLKSRR